MATTDRDYHEKRAREEVARAGGARSPSAKRVHRELAALHAELAGKSPRVPAEKVALRVVG